jgi:hypothetical protein
VSEAAGGWEECGLSLGKRPASRENARRNEAERGPSFDHGPRWPEIGRMPAALRQSLEDVWREFVV